MKPRQVTRELKSAFAAPAIQQSYWSKGIPAAAGSFLERGLCLKIGSKGPHDRISRAAFRQLQKTRRDGSVPRIRMKTLGKYELLEEIGGGGMGKICRARDRVLHREVAIKTIYVGQTDPEIKQRFYREARACATLSHPNIVTVFDLGEQQGVSYIAMELLEGEDLRRFIDRRGTMSLEAKVGFMMEVCDGLGHAHDNGVVHRDIKPGNIFVTKSGRPKILDFGIARIAASHLTQPGTALGTPKYMAPEQYLGKESDTLSDLFSAAIVFFEFLSYEHPFDGPSTAKTSARTGPSGAASTAAWRYPDVPSRIVKEEPLTLRSLNPAMPERLDRILSKALSKDSQARFQTAGELSKELKKVSVDLVRECSKLWNEVLEHRKRVLELEAIAADYLGTPWFQTALKKVNVDLSTAEKIRPDTSATVVADLHFFDLVAQRDEISRTESLLTHMTDEVSKTRRGIEEARALLQQGDAEGATGIARPLSERFPDHPQIISLMREIRFRSAAAALEKALAENNLANALELLNDSQSLAGTNSESLALVESLRSRVGETLAAKDVLCEGVRAALRQIQNAVAGNDASKIETLAFSLDEMIRELERKYSSDKMPAEIRDLVASCRAVRTDADLQVARIKIGEALIQGDLKAVRKSLQTIKDLCAGDSGRSNFLAEVQRQVIESVLGTQDIQSMSAATPAEGAHTQFPTAETAKAPRLQGEAASADGAAGAPASNEGEAPEKKSGSTSQTPPPDISGPAKGSLVELCVGTVKNLSGIVQTRSKELKKKLHTPKPSG
jgi:serine/threonine protein kinase